MPYFPFLKTPLLPFNAPFVKHLPLCNALQHLSTILGLVAVSIAYRNWYRRADTERSISLPGVSRRLKTALIASILILSPIFGATYSYAVRHRFGVADYPKKRLADAVESGMALGAMIFLGYAVLKRPALSRDTEPLAGK